MASDHKTCCESSKRNVLILGASYGSLLSTKLLLAGHDVTLVCREGTAKILNERGSIVRMPLRNVKKKIQLKSSSGRKGNGKLRARTPDRIKFNNNHDDDDKDKDNNNCYDLVVLAMQEPQYSANDVRKLVQRVAAAKIPVMALTNMPLPPFLARIPGLEKVIIDSNIYGEDNKSDNDDVHLSTLRSKIRSCYTDPELWDVFMTDIGLFTQCSPDPQAFRPPEESPNILEVRLPTNFKAARFESDEHTSMLRQIEQDIQKIRYVNDDDDDDDDDEKNKISDVAIELPVKLRVHESLFVPLAKWAMLLAGNYRCIEKDETIVSIYDAIFRDLERSRRIYNFVNNLCVELGGNQTDLVSFEKYITAVKSLKSPSSAAREIYSGSINIERVDKIVALIAQIDSKENNNVNDNYDTESFEIIEGIVKTIDDWLEKNKNSKK